MVQRLALLALAAVVLGPVGSAQAELWSSPPSADATIVSTGDGDLFAEPGEEVRMRWRLHNNGSGNWNPLMGGSGDPQPLTTVRGTVDHWSNIALVSGRLNWPDLQPGQSATSSDEVVFTSNSPTAFECGRQIETLLSVDTDQGSGRTQVDIPTGEPGTPATWTASPGSHEIAPGATIDVPAMPTIRGRVWDLDVHVDLEHPALGDLALHAVASSGRSVTLLWEEGGSTPGLSNATFDDEAAVPFGPSATPISGRVATSGRSLWWFRDELLEPGRPWTLHIENHGSRAGRLNSWGATSTPARCRDSRNQPSAAYQRTLAPSTGKFSLTVPRRVRIADANRRGIPVTVKCRRVCAVDAELQITRRRARRLGLNGPRARKLTVAASARARPKSRHRFLLRPNARVRRALRRARRVPVLVRVTSGGTSARAKVELTRRKRR